MKRIILICSLALLNTACSGIYIGNVKFTEEEICSKEYTYKGTNKVKNYIACIPPQRHEDAAAFFFTGKRTLIEANDINALNAKTEHFVHTLTSDENSPPSTIAQNNPLPSFIGRLVRANSLTVAPTGQPNMSLPASGNFSFPAMEGIDLKELKTQVLLSTHMQASLQKSLNVNADFDISKILMSDLVKLPKEIKENTKLLNELDDISVALNSANTKGSTSIGSFQYVSLEYDFLDKTLASLSSKGLLHETTNNSITDTEINIYTNKIKEILKKNPKTDFGLIIGAAVLNTSQASAFNCSTFQGSATNTEQESLENIGCTALKARITSALDDAIKESAKNLLISDNELKAAQGNISAAGEKMVNAYLGYRSAQYKELRIDGHSSIYSIHYIPLKNSTN